jgi:hypothetical protein
MAFEGPLTFSLKTALRMVALALRLKCRPLDLTKWIGMLSHGQPRDPCKLCVAFMTIRMQHRPRAWHADYKMIPLV